MQLFWNLRCVSQIRKKQLEDTVESALDQIIEKKYDAELLGLGDYTGADQALWVCV